MIGASARERQEAESFVLFTDPRVGPAGRLHANGPLSLKKADPRARSAGLTRGSAENNSRVMMA